VSNPRFNMRCLEWCASAAKCLARLKAGQMQPGEHPHEAGPDAGGDTEAEK